MDNVQHFELPYKSRDRAKKFYFDVFDWQLFDTPGTGYTFAATVPMEKNGMPKRPGAINGGLTPRGEHQQGPSVLIHVGDVNSALGRIRRAGGTVLTEPVRMGPVLGARFRDPEGNVLGVFQDVAGAIDEERQASGKPAKGKASKAKPAKKPKAQKGKPSKKKR